ncbi:MAG: hypothetical protein A2Y15_04395 [Clostridiales bacterium GWF2_36_10]|nr:MAG: hypothetical protein A2Y15_04395 [Clostridiales bacterium GWF2_36_10]
MLAVPQVGRFLQGIPRKRDGVGIGGYTEQPPDYSVLVGSRIYAVISEACAAEGHVKGPSDNYHIGICLIDGYLVAFAVLQERVRDKVIIGVVIGGEETDLRNVVPVILIRLNTDFLCDIRSRIRVLAIENTRSTSLLTFILSSSNMTRVTFVGAIMLSSISIFVNINSCF